MSFNVLDRNQNINKSYLLEASAGTGKTFAIENIYVRLILEKDFDVSQILVVTFTRQAVRDLKNRLRKNLLKTLNYFNDINIKEAPDYLLPYLSLPEDVKKSYRQRMSKALFLFEEAEIHTIHGFCSKMLRQFIFEGNISFKDDDENLTLSDEKIISLIHNFFRTGLDENFISKAQLQIVLNLFSGSIDNLKKEILRILKTGLEIEPQKTFEKQFSHFLEDLKKIKGILSEKLIEDFEKEAPFYKEIMNKNGEISLEILEKIKNFACLLEKSEHDKNDFDNLIKDGLVYLDALHSSKLKKQKSPFNQDLLNYPHLKTLLQNTLYPIVEEARNGCSLLAKIAHGCQKSLSLFLKEEEVLHFDYLLKAMQKSLDNEKFIEKIRLHYKAAVVDEFQDTDPVQWDIFNRLFNTDKCWGHLYLVGDPKQSIYAFRQADIYTYLQASNTFEDKSKASLETNFRSDKNLIEALNALFNPALSPQLIHLPKLNQVIKYKPVRCGLKGDGFKFSDNLGAIHFIFSKPLPLKRSYPLEELEKQLFPQFLAEIKKLTLKDQFKLSQCAFLVSDRFQGHRLVDFLKNHEIEALFQKSASLKESDVLADVRDLLQAIFHPKKVKFIKKALGGKIIGWNKDEILELENLSCLDEIVATFLNLRKIWLQKGFPAFFTTLKETVFKKDLTLSESLLYREIEIFDEFEQIFYYLIEKQYREKLSPPALLNLIDDLILKNGFEEEHLKKQKNTTLDAVKVITLHSSKGLEFEIVFTLGLVTRNFSKPYLIPVKKGNSFFLSPVKEDSIEYQEYLKEQEAEKLRQLYVALTRAKHRLYIPFGCIEKSEFEENLSPIELFVKQMYGSGSLDQKLKNAIQNLSKTTSISYSECLDEDFSFLVNKQKEVPHLIEPSVWTFSFASDQIHSFTSLSEKKEFQKDDFLPPSDFQPISKNIHTLPAGNETGILLHTILEKMDWRVFKKVKEVKELYPFIKPFLELTPFEEWLEVIAELIFTIFSTPLTSSFCLKDINTYYLFKELEFLYPLHTPSEYIKGVIDGIFYHEDKYFIIDWKSNWLGPDLSCYNQKNLYNAMEANDYFLQIKLYKEALERYLKVTDPRPFTSIYGGTFYLFIRGLAQNDPSSGIFYFNK